MEGEVAGASAGATVAAAVAVGAGAAATVPDAALLPFSRTAAAFGRVTCASLAFPVPSAPWGRGVVLIHPLHLFPPWFSCSNPFADTQSQALLRRGVRPCGGRAAPRQSSMSSSSSASSRTKAAVKRASDG